MNKLCVFLFMSFLGIGKMYSTDYNGRNIVKLCENHNGYSPTDIYWNSDFLNEVSSYTKIDEVNYYHNGQWHTLGNTNDLIVMLPITQDVITVQFINQRVGQNHYYYSTVHIIRADEEYFNLPQDICVGDKIDLHDYTSIQHFGSFSTNSSPMYIAGASSDELHISPSAVPNTYDVTWTIQKAGTFHNCIFNYDKNIEIREKPVITWSNQFPTSNQILDSDNTPIPLNGTSTAGGVMIYNGAGVSNGAITPSNAGYGTHTLTAYATTQYGCKDTTTQTIEITHDAGIPGAPQIKSPSSGVITSQDFYFSQSVPTGYAPNQPFSQEYSEMHVCDGQPITISINNPTPLSIDSVRYIYNNNGNYDTIGTYIVNNSTITYTIPQTGSARIDYIVSQFKTNLGVWGSAGNTPVFVTAVEPTTPLSMIVCGDEFRFYTVEQDQGVRYEPFLRPYNDGALNGGNDWINNENTYTTRLTDLNNNNLTYAQPNVYGVYTLTAPKTKTITRTVTTKVPYDDYGTGDIYSLVSNAQTCKFTDSITISRKPIVNFGYAGDSVIIGGTTVTITDSSQLSNYTTFDFFNNKGEQQGTSITDTLYSGQGNVLITAYDTLGCSTDSLVNLVVVTDNPGVGLLDNQTSGLVYPVANGLVPFSGLTDSLNSEMHVCDGQTISLQIDLNRLQHTNGIDSVLYYYYSNGNYDTIGKYELSQVVNYTIPTTNNKRIDSIYTELYTVLDFKGQTMVSPVFISHAMPQANTTQILNCDTALIYTDFIGQQSQDYDGLMQWSYQGANADYSTFETVFKDVYGQILFNSGNYFEHSLLSSEKSDTVFKTEYTKLPFRSINNNAYYNAITNPQRCVYNDTIVIVRPPIASFTHNAPPNITYGTGVRFISTSQFATLIQWDLHDGMGVFTRDTMFQYLYNIGPHDVSIMAYDDFGCADTLTEYGYTSVIDWTDIEEQNTISEVLSFPNPMQDNLTLKITATEEIEATIFILDMSGRVVLEKQIRLFNSENIKNLDVSRLTSGVYNCQIIGKNINLTQKLIKK